nr:MAG TPA: hypothetical protein [Caudoviricetes sp.]
MLNLLFFLCLLLNKPSKHKKIYQSIKIIL